MADENDIRNAFTRQVKATSALGSPFMARLMHLFAVRDWPEGAVAQRLRVWPGDPQPSADNVPLRLAGGLHALVIGAADPALSAVYPPHDVADDVLWSQVSQALVTHAAHLLRWLDQPPQTNEVRRSAALAPAIALIAGACGPRLALWEIGCSAGLNLRVDRFRVVCGPSAFGPADSPLLHRPTWDGASPAPVSLDIVERRGVDLAPLDPADPAARLRLRAYLWPDQSERRSLTDSALAIAADHPAQIDRGDAVEWLAASLPLRPDACTTVVVHTVAWQYLPTERQAAGDALLAEAGAQATSEKPLARIAMEADDSPQAGLSLTMWPGGLRYELARVDWHGRAATWTGPTRIEPVGQT